MEHRNRRRMRGMVLITSLLLLIVVTLLALAMFRSFGLDEKIAGNLRDKQLALHAAESAEQYAEYWLSGGTATTVSVTCSTLVPYTVGQICSNPLTNPTSVPWTNGTSAVGVTYAPPTEGLTNGTTMSQTPVFYVTNLGPPPSGDGTIYQIDAVGYGGSANTTAVVESTYLVQSSVKDLGAP